MLELVLKKKWFDLIESGIKCEEYRDIKPYWFKRIFTSGEYMSSLGSGISLGGYNGRHTHVRFRLGYAKDAPTMIWKLGHVGIGHAKPEWAEGHMGKMIVLQLQKRIE